MFWFAWSGIEFPYVLLSVFFGGGVGGVGRGLFKWGYGWRIDCFSNPACQRGNRLSSLAIGALYTLLVNRTITATLHIRQRWIVSPRPTNRLQNKLVHKNSLLFPAPAAWLRALFLALNTLACLSLLPRQPTRQPRETNIYEQIRPDVSLTPTRIPIKRRHGKYFISQSVHAHCVGSLACHQNTDSTDTAPAVKLRPKMLVINMQSTLVSTFERSRLVDVKIGFYWCLNFFVISFLLYINSPDSC